MISGLSFIRTANAQAGILKPQDRLFTSKEIAGDQRSVVMKKYYLPHISEINATLSSIYCRFLDYVSALKFVYVSQWEKVSAIMAGQTAGHEPRAWTLLLHGTKILCLQLNTS